MIHPSIQYLGKTDRGLLRTINEDAYAIRPESGLVMVADGMGGYSAGEVASQLAVDEVLYHLEGAPEAVTVLRQRFEQAIAAANQAILDAAHRTPELAGMGTTLVLGKFMAGELLFAWVGDSRLYRLRDARLEPLTVDHTLVQELVERGVFPSTEAAVRGGVGDNVLTRALGAEPQVRVSMGREPLLAGDLYLFCSDGLNHMVDDRDIGQVLRETATDLEAAADRLVELACAQGGRDNITLVLARVNDPGAA